MFFQREFRPNRRCCRRTEGCTSQLKLPSFLVGLFLSITLSQILLSVRPIFTVLPITLSFLVHFQPEKYWIEGLDMLFSMVRRWSIQSWFWPGHCLGQTSVQLGQLWLTLVKLGQHRSNLSKPHEMCPRHLLKASWCIWTTLGSNSTESGCLVLHANTRENHRGKNRVMTVAPSLLGVVWHKEYQTMNKWLNFCSLKFS